MAAAAARPISNIAMAFAAAGNGGGAAHNTSSNDNIANAPSTSLPIAQAAKMGDHPLPTPPNSISPTLPPHRVRGSEHLRLASAPSAPQHPPHIHVDSDMDMQIAEPSPDSGDMGNGLGLGLSQPQPLSSAALSALSAPDPTGAITPQMLAAHHLPEVLLANGPIAIRYVLAHLTQSVPGFARIPPAKARRLVVAALESRQGGGERGEIVFEKVGWGRWDARKRGEPSRHASTAGLSIPRGDALSPPASIPGSYALSSAGDQQIPPLGRVRRRWSASNGDGSNSTSGGGLDMWAEHQADNMSLDGSDDDDSALDGYAQPRIKELPIDEGDSDDATDEEDWAGMGAAALRQASLSVPKSSCVAYPRGSGLSSSTRLKTHPSPAPGSDHMARSVPMPVPARPQQWRENRHVASSAGSRAASRRGSSSYHPYATSVDQRMRNGSVQHGIRGMEMIVDTEGTGTQEREAIEALLRMGGR